MSTYTTTEKDFVITRTIDAPRKAVFKAWTDPAQLKQWWAPKIFTNPVCEIDLAEGGAYRIVMRSPEGIEYPIEGVYREIVEPELLVFTMNTKDHPYEWHEMVNKKRPNRKGNLEELLTRVRFEDDGNKTKLTVEIYFISVEDCKALIQLGMNEGWAESLDKLEGFVAKA